MSKVYALNPFNVANKDEYLAYSKRPAKEVQARGGRTKLPMCPARKGGFMFGTSDTMLR